MDSIPYLYVALALAVGGLALIAVWSRRKPLWKTVAVCLVAAILALSYFSYVELLSKPKPLRLERADTADAEVISAMLAEDEAIYLWLRVDGAPRFYEMPWDKATALELQTVMREARRAGTSVAMRGPTEAEEPESGDGSNEDQPQVETFYAVPAPIVPPEKQPIVVENPRWRM